MEELRQHVRRVAVRSGGTEREPAELEPLAPVATPLHVVNGDRFVDGLFNPIAVLLGERVVVLDIETNHASKGRLLDLVQRRRRRRNGHGDAVPRAAGERYETHEHP